MALLPDLLPLASAPPAVLWTLEAVWVLGAALWMISERRSPAATLAWILALGLLPLVGIPLYLFLGPRRIERKNVRRALAKRESARLRAAFEAASARVAPERQQLMRLACGVDVMPPETATGLALFTDGDAAFDAIAEAVRAARDHIHLEYYIFRPDATGTRLRDLLVERARAGVEVRLLVDAAGSPRLGRFLRPLVAAGGRVARFNPAFGGRRSSRFFNFRTHRKIVVCDGRVGFTGGVNVCDDHSRAARGADAWRDTHLRLEGNAVHGLQLTFVEDWRFSSSEALSLQRGPDEERLFPRCPVGPHTVQVIASGPDQERHAAAAFYFGAITSARERVWLTTPYFVPDDALLAALASAALRGVEVKLLLPRRTDNVLVDAAGSTYHAELLRAGVQISLYGPPMIHAKTCVVDRDLAVVGTANLDNRSLRLNFEVLAAVYGGPLVEELAAAFQRDLAAAKPLPHRWHRGSLGRRLFASAARLLSSEL
jgi:cardiolipin synthase A/B